MEKGSTAPPLSLSAVSTAQLSLVRRYYGTGEAGSEEDLETPTTKEEIGKDLIFAPPATDSDSDEESGKMAAIRIGDIEAKAVALLRSVHGNVGCSGDGNEVYGLVVAK